MTVSATSPQGSDLEGRAQPRRGRSDPQGIQKSILQTLKYSDHFSFPLTLSEIHLRLVGARFSRPQIAQILDQLLKENIIQKTGEYYYLSGHISLIAKRQDRQRLSKPQLESARLLAAKLGGVPGVVAVYLTGSLAMNNSDDTADIDLMIITKDDRLWTTRLCLTIYTELLGLRRRPYSPHSSGKVCLNLYLSPKSYALPLTKRSLYTAYELIQARPLYDPHNTHKALLLANPWINSYLPNAIQGSDLVPKGRLLDRRPERSSSRDAEGGRCLPIGSWTILKVLHMPGQTFMELVESLCYHLQLFYMRPKLTREYITPDSAFFHPNDPSPRGLSLKGIPGCKPRRAQRQLEGESSRGVKV